MSTTGKRLHETASTSSQGGSHRFGIGQQVRMAAGFAGLSTRVGEIYRITGKLPPSGNEPQYRIRNENEAYERVTTEDRLEPVDTANTALRDRTFHG